MVTEHDGYFLLSTASTSLLLQANKVGKLVSLYYGNRLLDEREWPALSIVAGCCPGTSLAYDEKKAPAVSLDALHGELSTGAQGDFLYPSLILSRPDLVNFDFVYDSFFIRKPLPIPGLPTPHGAEEELVIALVDKAAEARLRLHYFVYEESEVIGRYLEVVNEGEKPLTIDKIASYQFVTPNRDYVLRTLYGSWINEGNVDKQSLHPGRFVFGSDTGSSSNRHNPYFSLMEKGAGLNEGHGYAFNLVYSGSHEESVELDSFGRVRLSAGISSRYFRKTLAKGASFATPMGVMTTSEKGLNGLMGHCHRFVDDCVVPERFAHMERPIVYNNWEATYFKFTKGKLVSLMDEAKKLGIEYFVLDDGWFGDREDDTKGLGDWFCNERKIPGGLKSLSLEAKKRGLGFGVWMEPEMVNEDSDLYRAHPDWIIRDEVHKPVKGRHQFVLDLTKKEVREFVYGAVKGVLSSADISFLKWDYNRPIADIPGGKGTFMHDYILGLYEVLGRLKDEFPNVLIEQCASGGNRFDLGMLSFAPQIWTSDDTDCHQRVLIQSGIALGYPLSTISCHVSAKTSMQLLRKTSLDSKFDVAAFGVLGYELDLSELTPLDRKVVAGQIAFYKAHRKAFQFGTFRESESFADSRYAQWQTSLGKETLVGRYLSVAAPAPEEGYLKAVGLDEKKLYRVAVRPESIDIKTFGSLINFVSPVHLKSDGLIINAISKRRGLDSEKDSGLVSGAALGSGGFALSEEWAGTGYNDHVRFLGDFGGRVYLIEEAE
jgi:alpha-galactosidase